MAPRLTKSERINAVVNIIRRGEFTNYSKAALKYGYNYSTLLKHVWGLTKLKKNTNLFFY